MASGQLILDPYIHIPPLPASMRQELPPAHWGLPAVPNFTDWKLGDIVLVAGAGVMGALINGGQRVIAPHAKSGAMWSHAGIYSGDGQIIEAVPGSGIREDSLEDYCTKRSLSVIRLDPDPNGLAAITVTIARQRIGDSYAWGDIVRTVKNWRKGVPSGGSVPGNDAYCSALIAQCYSSHPVNTPLDTVAGFAPCLPANLALHPWLIDVPVEWRRR